jgi:hypothetical protein
LLRGKLRTPFELQTGEGFFSLLLAIARADLQSVAVSNEILTIVLLLTLQIYGRHVADRTFFAITAITITDSEAAANLTKLSLTSENDSVLMFETAVLIASALVDQDIMIIGNLLGSLIGGSRSKECKHAYLFIINLLANGRCPTCFMYFMTLTASDSENSAVRTRLLEMYNTAGGLKVRVQTDLALPIIAPRDKCTLIRMIADFARIEEYPPLCVTDEEVAECQSVKKSREEIELMKIEPMHSWDIEIALAQQAVVEIGSNHDLQEVSIDGNVTAARIDAIARCTTVDETLPLTGITERELVEDNT